MKQKEYGIFSLPVIVGALMRILLLFQFLRSFKILGDYTTAAWITGVIVLLVGFVSALYTKESFGKDLNFVER